MTSVQARGAANLDSGLGLDGADLSKARLILAAKGATEGDSARAYQEWRAVAQGGPKLKRDWGHYHQRTEACLPGPRELREWQSRRGGVEPCGKPQATEHDWQEDEDLP